MTTFADNIPEWAESMNCAVTVCDADCTIIYQNEKARGIYKSHGDLTGHNLLDCHPERAKTIIGNLLTTGGSNAYTIEKNGIHKVIYQTAWRKPDGSVGGLVEISMEVHPEMPHFVRS